MDRKLLALEKRLAELEAALVDIIDPVNALKRQADAEGAYFNGIVAVRLAQDPEHLRSLARNALYEIVN